MAIDDPIVEKGSSKVPTWFFVGVGATIGFICLSLSIFQLGRSGLQKQVADLTNQLNAAKNQYQTLKADNDGLSVSLAQARTELAKAQAAKPVARKKALAKGNKSAGKKKAATKRVILPKGGDGFVTRKKVP